MPLSSAALFIMQPSRVTGSSCCRRGEDFCLMVAAIRRDDCKQCNTDFAAETANFTQNQVLMQVGATVLQNANQSSQLVLTLMKNL